LDIVNWLLGHITVNAATYSDNIQNSLTGHVETATVHYYNVDVLPGLYTYGDIAQSIWQLLGDGQAVGDTFLGSYNMGDVKDIVDQAVTHDGYVPDAGQKIAVLLDTGLGRQPLLIETQAAALGDYVWHDLNANGIQDEVGTGIAGATVNLVRDLNSDGIITANEILATTTTDATGYYEFKGLTPGLTYQVQFVKPTGYDAVSPRQSDSSTTSDVNSDGLVSNVVVLAPGEFNPTIDSGFYKFASLGDFADPHRGERGFERTAAHLHRPAEEVSRVQGDAVFDFELPDSGGVPPAKPRERLVRSQRRVVPAGDVVRAAARPGVQRHRNTARRDDAHVKVPDVRMRDVDEHVDV
jgi:hypothetical protein